jgi:hypothetical protein
VVAQSHNLKNSLLTILCHTACFRLFRRCNNIPEKEEINITERLQTLGDTITKYKDSVVAHFKDMEVDVKDWNFAVGKTEEEYTVEVKVKIGIKPKKK